MRTAAFLVGMLLLMACQDGRSQPNDAQGDKPANQGTYYEVSVAPDEVSVNEKGAVVVSLTPGSGYKWNDEYPAKFALTAPEGVALEKADFKAKEVEVSAKAARLTIPLTVAAAGEKKIEVKGSFSVCNDTSCKIMRNETFNFTVKGK